MSSQPTPGKHSAKLTEKLGRNPFELGAASSRVLRTATANQSRPTPASGAKLSGAKPRSPGASGLGPKSGPRSAPENGLILRTPLAEWLAFDVVGRSLFIGARGWSWIQEIARTISEA